MTGNKGREMKKLFLTITMLSLLISCQKFYKFKVASLNIRNSRGRDGRNIWDNRKDIILDFINNQEISVLGLQEVLPDQYSYLKNNLPNYTITGVSRLGTKDRGESCPVIFNQDRFKLLDSSTFWLSETPQQTGSKSWRTAFARIVTWVKLLDLKSEQSFYFFNTHFDHYSKEARRRSALLLLSKINRIAKKQPFILAGDFNCEPGSEPYQILTGKWKGIPKLEPGLLIKTEKQKKSMFTYNGFNENKHHELIDHIFLSSNIKNIATKIHKIKKDGIFISDHYPIVSKVRLTGDKSKHGRGPVLPLSLYPPYIKNGDIIFSDSTGIQLDSYNRNTNIHYTLNGSIPTQNSPQYRNPIIIRNSCTLKARTYRNGDSSKTVLSQNFYRSILDTNQILSEVIFNIPVSPEYFNSGVQILVDKKLGSVNDPGSGWLGFHDNSIDIVLDFGEPVEINKLVLDFLVDFNLKSFPPCQITLLSSDNSLSYDQLYSKEFAIKKDFQDNSRFAPEIEIEGTHTRYLRIIARNLEKCPKWHSAKGSPTWIFIDEIILN